MECPYTKNMPASSLQALDFLINLNAKVTGEEVNNSQSAWGPATQVGDLDGETCLWLQLVPPLAVEAT